MQNDERKKEIERLQEQVRHAEAHGQTDTAHHEMLKRLLQKPEPKKETKES